MTKPLQRRSQLIFHILFLLNFYYVAVAQLHSAIVVVLQLRGALLAMDGANGFLRGLAQLRGRAADSFGSRTINIALGS